MLRAPVAIARGNTKAFVNDPSMLDQVFRLLDGSLTQSPFPTSCVLECSPAAETVPEGLSESTLASVAGEFVSSLWERQ